jgi:hypothetical protein
MTTSTIPSDLPYHDGDGFYVAEASTLQWKKWPDTVTFKGEILKKLNTETDREGDVVCANFSNDSGSLRLTVYND